MRSSAGRSARILVFIPRWCEEKWCGRPNAKQNYYLLEGNGGPHVIVVFGNGVGLNFEDLAGSRMLRKASTTAFMGLQALLWVGLLVLVDREEGQT